MIWAFLLRYKVIIFTILFLLLIKVVWVIWSCWGNGSFDKEKKELIQRKNFLVRKIVVEPCQLLNEMPGGIGLQFQGEWALYSCSMLTEALSTWLNYIPKQEKMRSQKLIASFKLSSLRR